VKKVTACLLPSEAGISSGNIKTDNSSSRNYTRAVCSFHLLKCYIWDQKKNKTTQVSTNV